MGNPTGLEYHYFPGSPPLLSIFAHLGISGIDLFFAISGFIMITTTWQKFGAPGVAGAASTFFLRRCIRIYPPYWIALIPLTCVFLIAPNLLTQFHAIHPNLLASYLLLPQAATPLLIVSWTLVFEMYFYLVFTFLFFVQRRFMAIAIMVWLVVEIGLNVLFGASPNAVLSFLGQPFAIEFILGMAVGLAYLRGKLPSPQILFGLFLATYLAYLALTSYFGTMPDVERIAFCGLTSAFLIYAAVSLEELKGVRAPRWAVSIGDSSYALYLWHLLVLGATAFLIGKLRPHGLLIHALADIVMIAIVYAFAWTVYRYVERPVTAYLNATVSSAMKAP